MKHVIKRVNDGRYVVVAPQSYTGSEDLYYGLSPSIQDATLFDDEYHASLVLKSTLIQVSGDFKIVPVSINIIGDNGRYVNCNETL